MGRLFASSFPSYPPASVVRRPAAQSPRLVCVGPFAFIFLALLVTPLACTRISHSASFSGQLSRHQVHFPGNTSRRSPTRLP
jgi:hypothetical protein